MPRHKLSRHIVALAAYSAITLVVTYPMAWRLGAHIPGDGDAPWFLWQLWWFKHALIDLGRSPLTTNLIYYPLNDVPVTWQSPINELAAIPLVAAFGPLLTYNLLLLSAFVLAGYGMYLLGWQALGRRDLAFVAGLIYSFSAYHGMRGLHHLSLATIQWLPLALAAAISCWRKPGPRRAVAAGVTAALVALSSPYYAAYFLLPAALAGSVYVALWRRQALRRPALWRAAALALSSALLLALPFYATLVLTEPDVQQAARQAAAAASVYAADVLSWLLPPRDNPLWRPLLAPIYAKLTAGYLVETALFFGFLPLALSLAALVLVTRNRTFRGSRSPANSPSRFPISMAPLPLSGRGFWRLLFILALLLSFGPVLRLWQEPLVQWMPYRLFMALPGAYAFRAPARAGLTAILAGALLALAMVKLGMARRPAWPWRPFLVAWSALLMVNMLVAFPYPTANATLPAAYEPIVAAAGRGAVLDLPAGEHFQERMAWAMAYQTWHQKPLVSGYLGRRPERLQTPEQSLPFVRRFFRQDWDAYFAGRWQDLVQWPPAVEVLAGAWPDDIRHARSLLAEQGIRYVLLQRAADNPSYFQPASVLLSQGLGPPAYSDQDTLRFDVLPPSWTPRGPTAALDSAALRFGPAFSAAFLHRQSQARAVALSATATATATLDLPVAGQWRLQGQLEGGGAGAAQFLLDGQPIESSATPLFDSVHAFQATLDLPAGQHELAIRRPPVGAAPAGSGPCRDLCVLNLAVNLESPRQVTKDAPLATFVAANGEQAALMAAQVARSTSPDSAAGPVLLTQWRLPTGADTASLPTLYVHITDAAGATIAQADHLLAERSLWRSDADASSTMIDLVDLPADVVGRRDLQIRIGLWRPAEQTHYWIAEPGRSDAAGRLLLGALADLAS